MLLHIAFTMLTIAKGALPNTVKILIEFITNTSSTVQCTPDGIILPPSTPTFDAILRKHEFSGDVLSVEIEWSNKMYARRIGVFPLGTEERAFVYKRLEVLYASQELKTIIENTKRCERVRNRLILQCLLHPEEEDALLDEKNKIYSMINECNKQYIVRYRFIQERI